MGYHCKLQGMLLRVTPLTKSRCIPFIYHYEKGCREKLPRVTLGLDLLIILVTLKVDMAPYTFIASFQRLNK